MRPVLLPAIFAGAVWGAMLARVLWVWDRLPDRMATHFGADGVANGWMSRSTYVLFTALLEGGTVLGLFLLPLLLRRLPSSLINLPNRELWLSERHRPQTIAWLALAMAWFAVAMAVFLFVLNELVLDANLSARPLDGTWLFIAAAGLIAAGGVQLAMILRRFRRPPT